MTQSNFLNLASKSKKPLWFLYSVILFHQLLTSLAFPIAKLGLNQIDPFTYAFIRFTLSSAIYLPILLLLRNRMKIPARDHLRIFLIGIILIPFNQVLFLLGQSMTSASHSSLLFATVPIFIYVLAIVFLGEKPTVRRTAGILVAAGGVYVILSGGTPVSGTASLAGDLLILLAVVAWAVATVMAKPLAVRYGAFRVTGHALVYGSLLYFPYGLYRAVDFRFDGVSWVGWFSVLYMALVVSLVAYILWYWVLKYMEASRVAVLQNIQPVIASAVAAVVLAEQISSGFVLGGIIVIAGVVLTELK